MAKGLAGKYAADPWWRGAVIYQIYPRSFKDSNGDGIGDLPGITQKLDYVANLGVDAIWLSPFFTSPMRDFGYDVANYCDVDPIFGKLDDFDQLIHKAHGLGLKIIIDQVYSHTSDEHEWFKRSRQSQKGDKADWYVWAEPKTDGSPPSNWQSVFGGPAWEWDARRGQYYLHNFLASQPDLNLHNPEVRAALLDVSRFWLERGVDGFRLDAINFAMHDPKFTDNPAKTKFKRPPTRPFDFQERKYNQSHPNIVKFLEEIRTLTNEFGDIFTVAEIGGDEPLAEMKAYTQGENRLNSAYNFAYLYADQITAEYVVRSSADWQNNGQRGWPGWAFSNHDAPRAVSRWADPEHREALAKCLVVLLLSLRGNAFIYQGEELGLPQAYVAFEQLQDPEAIANWPETLGRDGARTPFPWKKSAADAGFGSANSWLPIDPAHFDLAVDQQENSPQSILQFYRKMIALRRKQNLLQTADIEFLDSEGPIEIFLRKNPGNEVAILGIFNLSNETRAWPTTISPEIAAILIDSHADNAQSSFQNLAPWQALLMRCNMKEF